jgi:hypothetical protein
MATEATFYGQHPTARTPTIVGLKDDDTVGVIMPARPTRKSWYVQNNSANALIVTMEDSKIVLKAATAADTGDGGAVNIQEYKGPVEIDGTNPNYNWQETYD